MGSLVTKITTNNIELNESNASDVVWARNTEVIIKNHFYICVIQKFVIFHLFPFT